MELQNNRQKTKIDICFILSVEIALLVIQYFLSILHKKTRRDYPFEAQGPVLFPHPFSFRQKKGEGVWQNAKLDWPL